MGSMIGSFRDQLAHRTEPSRFEPEPVREKFSLLIGFLTFVLFPLGEPALVDSPTCEFYFIFNNIHFIPILRDWVQYIYLCITIFLPNCAADLCNCLRDMRRKILLYSIYFILVCLYVNTAS